MRKKLAPFASLFAALLVLACACAPEAVLEEIVCADVVPPVFLSSRAPAADRLELVFSEPVRVASLRFSPELEVSALEDGAETVRVDFGAGPGAGERCVFDLVAEDAEGNTVSVAAPFIGRNDNPAPLIVNEVRTEYSKPKVEFVELYCSGAGELGGLRLVSSEGGAGEPLFVFPPCAVSAGEYVTIHLRSMEEGIADETGPTDASAGTDSSPTARDFWTPGAVKRIRKTDLVAVLDSDGLPLDAAAFSETPASPWKNEAQSSFFAFLEAAGAWIGSPASSAGATATRTIGRKPSSEDGNGGAEWAVAATGGASPGGPNADAFYVPAASSVRRGP